MFVKNLKLGKRISGKYILDRKNAQFVDDFISILRERDLAEEVENAFELRQKINLNKIKKNDGENISRTDIYALGFLTHKKWSEVDQLLNAAGYDRLYPRNPIDASLIYAYETGMGFEEWSELYEKVKGKINEENPIPGLDRGKIKFGELKKFVKEYSEEKQNMYGENLTRDVTTAILNVELRKAIEKKDFWGYFDTQSVELKNYRFKSLYYIASFIVKLIQGQIDAYLQVIEKYLSGGKVSWEEYQNLGSQILLRGKVEDKSFSTYNKAVGLGKLDELKERIVEYLEKTDTEKRSKKEYESRAIEIMLGGEATDKERQKLGLSQYVNRKSFDEFDVVLESVYMDFSKYYGFNDRIDPRFWFIDCYVEGDFDGEDMKGLYLSPEADEHVDEIRKMFHLKKKKEKKLDQEEQKIIFSFYKEIAEKMGTDEVSKGYHAIIQLRKKYIAKLKEDGLDLETLRKDQKQWETTVNNTEKWECKNWNTIRKYFNLPLKDENPKLYKKEESIILETCEKEKEQRANICKFPRTSSVSYLKDIFSGKRAISRSYLILFAVYAGKTEGYISHILESCGFDELDKEERVFDMFASELIERQDDDEERMNFLEEYVYEMAEVDYRISFLYNVGKKGVENSDDSVEKILEKRKK